MLADLVPDVDWVQATDGDRRLAAAVKGDVRMADVLAKAVRDRERPLRDDLVVPFGLGYAAARRRDVSGASCAAPAGGSARTTRPAASSRARSGRRWPRAAATEVDPGDGARARCATPTRCAPRSSGCGRCSRRRSCCTTCSARRPCCSSPRAGQLDDDEIELAAPPAVRRRRRRACGPTPTSPLLDEARELLGPKPRQRAARPTRPTRSAPTATSSSTRRRTSRRCSCGCSTRRSLNGSMTVVGDIAQATGALAPDSWDDVLAHLPTASRPASSS